MLGPEIHIHRVFDVYIGKAQWLEMHFEYKLHQKLFMQVSNQLGHLSKTKQRIKPIEGRAFEGLDTDIFRNLQSFHERKVTS